MKIKNEMELDSKPFNNPNNLSEEDIRELKNILKFLVKNCNIIQLAFCMNFIDNFIRKREEKYPKELYNQFMKLSNYPSIKMSCVITMIELNSDITMDIIDMCKNGHNFLPLY